MNVDQFEIINAHNFNLDNIKIKAVLFDMDGIIINSEILYTRFWQEACHFYGFPMTYEQSLTMRSINSTVGQQKLHAYFGETADYHTIRNKRIELMTAFVNEHGIELKPGIRELLTYLKSKGIIAAITTASPLERATSYLAPHNLAKEFDRIITGYMVERSKPSPDIYIYAAEQVGFDVKNCMVLEDSPSGVTAGSSAGCVTVMVPDLDQPTEEIRQMLFAKADSLHAIIDLIEKLHA